MSLCSDCKCALCCDGTLYSRAPLQQSELAQHSQRLEVFVVENDDGAGNPGSNFRLPCTLCVNDSCSKYQERPAICADYVCLLFKSHAAGITSTAQARVLIDNIKQLRAQLLPVLTTFIQPDSAISFTDLIKRAVVAHETRLAAGQAGLPNEVLLKVALLRVLLAKHFDSRLTRHTHEANQTRAMAAVATPLADSP